MPVAANMLRLRARPSRVAAALPLVYALMLDMLMFSAMLMSPRGRLRHAAAY